MQILRRMRPVAIVLFLCVAAFACFAAFGSGSLSFGSGIGNDSAVNANGSPIPSKQQAIANAKCRFGDKPACPTPVVPWVPLRSESPADVLAAAQSTGMFQSAMTGDDAISVALKSGTLGQPALVKPYRDGTVLDTVWVIPVLGSAGTPSAMLEFVYDRPNHRLRAASFDAVGVGMFYGSHPFPFIDASEAASLAQQARKVSPMAGRAAELIYFPTDHTAVLTGQSPAWTGGGESVIDPIWRTPGADGRWYYVTHDRQVHLCSEIPIDAAFPAMPQTVS
jgi:hypothetical protein